MSAQDPYFVSWMAVCDTLDEVFPEWHSRLPESCGKDKACAAIRELARLANTLPQGREVGTGVDS